MAPSQDLRAQRERIRIRCRRRLIPNRIPPPTASRTVRSQRKINLEMAETSPNSPVRRGPIPHSRLRARANRPSPRLACRPPQTNRRWNPRTILPRSNPIRNSLAPRALPKRETPLSRPTSPQSRRRRPSRKGLPPRSQSRERLRNPPQAKNRNRGLSRTPTANRNPCRTRRG